MNDSTLANVRIRDETSVDAQGIRLVHQSAFDTAAEANLVDLLRERGKTSISLVAEIDDQIVGHILFSPVSIEPADSAWHSLGLAPVAVIPEKQGQGIGQVLVDRGLARGREINADLVVVLGDPSYYARFGFQRALDFGLGNEYGAEEHFMVLELKPGVLNQVGGLVSYAPEFNESGT